MSTLLIFPNQLFNDLPSDTRVVLWEHPVFVGFRPNAHIQLNKMRLAYQRYLQLVYVATHPNVEFVPYTSVPKIHNVCTIYDPLDHACLSSVKRKFKNINVIDTPAFLLTNKECLDYYASKKGKRLRHAPFFKYVKGLLGILQDVPSQDTYNREAYPKSLDMPPEPFPKYNNSDKMHVLSQAVEWAYSSFPKNHGPSKEWALHYLAKLPCNHSEAMTWLDKFVRERYTNFGKYQDAIVYESQWMFHSGLSIPLNYGLLTPKDIISKVQHRKVSLSSYEGFIRQICGWREYCRLYYLTVPYSVYHKNHFNFEKTKMSKDWYNGTTGQPLVDSAIKDGWKYGYLHHIRRLMVMANYFTLCKMHPDNVYKWMYEFSLDSNDVYMVFNCYSMGTYSDGGAATFKPYISSSNYIKKQSYISNGPWAAKWDALYRRFKT